MQAELLTNQQGRLVVTRKSEDLTLWSFSKKEATEISKLRIADLLFIWPLQSPGKSWIFLMDSSYNWSLADENMHVYTQGKLLGIGKSVKPVAFSWYDNERWNLVIHLKRQVLHYLSFTLVSGSIKCKTQELILSNSAHWPCRSGQITQISALQGSVSKDFRVLSK